MSTQMDSLAYRKALGSFTTGVTVVTAFDAEGRPAGVTASSFASVSLDPPLVSVCISRQGRTYPVFAETEKFAVNILAADQAALARRFAESLDDRFEGVDWTSLHPGGPLLLGCSATLDCHMHDQIDAGDHAILLGRVERFDVSEDAPLGYVRGQFFPVAVPKGH